MAEGVAGAAARELATEIIQLLTRSGTTVATAESLTGGLVAAALTDIPGSSNAFRGSVVASIAPWCIRSVTTAASRRSPRYFGKITPFDGAPT